jgi:pimeloyl-ACP methyl ester carboxylesterase
MSPRVDAPNMRTLTAGRIVALALIATLLAGLVYLRLASNPDAVSVPDGAKAGDLTLRPCDYATEGGTYEADCGTLVVPENRSDPQTRLIGLRVTRIRARSDHPRAPIFRLEGGPGMTNMKFTFAHRYAQDRDVVLVGYRGVDSSTVLECPEVESALKRSTDYLSETSFRRFADGFRRCARRHTEDGVDVTGYGLTHQADDLEAARVALGYDRINLLSESTGTRLAMIYAWRYPEHVRRSVMIGANPPGHFLWHGERTDAQLRRYAELCAQDDTCRERTDDLATAMQRIASDMPDRWGPLPIEDANVRIASFAGLFETTTKAAPMNAPMVLDSWLSAADGDPAGLWFASLAADLYFPEMFVWGQWAAIGVQDAPVGEAYFAAGGDRGSILGNPMAYFAWAGGRTSHAWPEHPEDAQYREVRTSNVETLVVSGELDVTTPPQVAAEELLPHLPNGHQVVLPGFGHTASFWNDQPHAGTRLVTTFLDSGRVDDSLYEPGRADFTPGLTHSTLAQIVVTTMVALALLTVLSLLWWMPRKVHKRGRFGRKTSAIVRSLYAVVLGLGGWCLGALTLVTTTRGVSLDNELLAVASVGMPVGLGLYWAWLRRDWRARTKATGLAAAIGGGIVGAWFGFGASEGLLAPLTAVVGAVAVANLALIVLDARRTRLIRAELATDPVVDVRKPAVIPAVPAGAGRG